MAKFKAIVSFIFLLKRIVEVQYSDSYPSATHGRLSELFVFERLLLIGESSMSLQCIYIIRYFVMAPSCNIYC